MRIETLKDQLKNCKANTRKAYTAAAELRKGRLTEDLHAYAFEAIWHGYDECFQKDYDRGISPPRRPKDVILENLKEYGEEATEFLEEKVVQFAAGKLGGSNASVDDAEELLLDVYVDHVKDGAGNMPAWSSFEIPLNEPLKFERYGYSHRVEALLRLARQGGGFQKAAPPLLRLLGDPDGSWSAGEALDAIQPVTLSSVEDKGAALPEPDYDTALEKLSAALTECELENTCGLVAAAIGGLSNIGDQFEKEAAHNFVWAVIVGSTEGARAAMKAISRKGGSSSFVFGPGSEDPVFAEAVKFLVEVVKDDGWSSEHRVKAAHALGELRKKGTKEEYRKRKAVLKAFAEQESTPAELREALKGAYEKKNRLDIFKGFGGKKLQKSKTTMW